MSAPQKLAVYYGWPSSVNATYTVAGAAAVFGDYDVVVFGAGLEETTHGDHQNTKDIIAHASMANTEVYGYVNLPLAQSAIEASVDKWNAMGVAGIFIDEFGFDYGSPANDRRKQNDAVDYVHSQGLKVIANAWDPDDVFVKSQGKDHHLYSDDYYMAESYGIKAGAYQSGSEWRAKSDKMLAHVGEAKMMCLTSYDSSSFDQDKFDQAYMMCVLDGFDIFGWGEDNYSATSASLPCRTRPSYTGNAHDGDIVEVSTGVFERQLNVGVHVDTTANTHTQLLD